MRRSDMEYIWVWNQNYGVRTMLGSYCDHLQFFGESKLPWGVFDETVRGYALVSPSQRQVTLTLSCANSRENSFFPEKTFLYFRRQYPTYLIVRKVQ